VSGKSPKKKEIQKKEKMFLLATGHKYPKKGIIVIENRRKQVGTGTSLMKEMFRRKGSKTVVPFGGALIEFRRAVPLKRGEKR